MPKTTEYGQIAIYPNETVRKAIEREALDRCKKSGARSPKLGPTVLEIVVEYLKKKNLL